MSSFEDTFVSVTELQKNTKKSLGDINGVKRKVILSNNKPKAVLLSVSEYTRLTKEASNIKSVEPDEWEKKAIEDYEKRKKNGKLESFIPTKEYFNSLK